VAKRPFLVRYEHEDIYAFVRARSKTEIYMRLPEVRVLDRPPGWLKAERLEELERQGTFDIDDDPAIVLSRLRARR
jgi:hypothetical protein